MQRCDQSDRQTGRKTTDLVSRGNLPFFRPSSPPPPTALPSLRARSATWLILCLPGSLLLLLHRLRPRSKKKGGRKPGQPPLSGGDPRWLTGDRGTFGSGRNWTVKGFAPTVLYLPHIAISSQNVWPVGRLTGQRAKNSNPIQITKAAGVNCRRRFLHGLFPAQSTVRPPLPCKKY